MPHTQIIFRDLPEAKLEAQTLFSEFAAHVDPSS